MNGNGIDREERSLDEKRVFDVIVVTVITVIGFACLFWINYWGQRNKPISSPEVTAVKSVAANKELPVVVRTVYISGDMGGWYFKQVIEVTRTHPGNNDQERYRLCQVVPFLASSAKDSIWFVGDEAVLKIDPYGLPVALRKP